ncbi:SIS domain-containing protein [Clostridioides difficile]|uniref:SIS domain-containing protein n=1 Tax=Clostridioides difficile TaxID=1496 RepID=UPI0002E4F5DB|nr:SIS domain-containing protein [Clostridioides difficile]AXU51840.1 sugar-phosphate isomerase [Clostridioides difficile]AXU66398.1 sugar-phosphate isomerase [Clostridioides difficile]AXU77432.1 sugar-phosphate isomerase [Clostridioides difficile]EJX3384929.1 SIS domain-containing protein [Clostridioides difficile]EJX3386503.1 SIS domain-containing protein [Clostridioides difficile]
MENTLSEFLDNISNELSEFIASIDETSINKACELILEAEKNHGRVHVTGIGKPGHVSGYISSLLSSTGTSAYILHGTEAVHGSSGQVVEGDVVIAISNSGETQELKATLKTLKVNGAKIIGVSGNESSFLKNISDIFLFAGVKQEGDCLNKAPRASILAETIVLQSLSVALQYAKGLNTQQYLKWHPAGSIGKSIREGI